MLQLTVSFEAHADKIVTVNREALAQALQAVIQEFNKQVQTTAGLPMIEQSITEMTRQIQQGVQPRPRSGRFSVPPPSRCSPIINSSPAKLSKTIETANRD